VTVDPDLKAKFVAALRSGRYRQGRSQLRGGDDCFCALGVLFDVGGCHWIRGEDCYTATFDSKAKSSYRPTRRMQDAVGLTDEQTDALIYLNDGRGLPFALIAAEVEATF
jgi:hypothetical protein